MANAKGSFRTAAVAAVAAATAISLAPARASATVYEVGDDGTVRAQRSGASISSDANLAVVGSDVAPEAAPEVPQAAITTIVEPSVPADFRQSVLMAAGRANVSPRLLAALTTQESRWRASAISPKGAIGLTQLMPATARALAVDPRDPAANLDGGARYLRQLIDQFDGNIERALAAYNAGPGRVVRASGIPNISETRAYVASIVDGLGGAVLSERRK